MFPQRMPIYEPADIDSLINVAAVLSEPNDVFSVPNLSLHMRRSSWGCGKRVAQLRIDIHSV